ncbi:cytochrome P450 9e2-like [Sitophilus oryzae]|uniref:Cytochrome P450 9e2-like n=1 Tax=Sitophilus oryzae TaxID=7048 RepID=A0A6J2YPC7_SITOR|nr:cytochrome P450 9e2-like [Sitophilus oryzae]QTM97435.1 Cytochrome P450 [Sitophilus oryzae]
MLLLTIISSAFFILFLIWYYGKRPLSYWKREKGVKQGDPCIFLGDTSQTTLQRMSLYEFVQHAYKMFPNERYSGMYLFTKPVLLIRDPELIKLITVKDFDHFADHNIAIEADVDPLWGGNLLALKGQKWRHMRTTISPFFTISKIKIMTGLMTNTAENFVNYFWKKEENVVEVELKDIYTRYATDVIGSTVFGINVDSLENPKNEFYQTAYDITMKNGVLKLLKLLAYILAPGLCKFFGVRLIERDIFDYFCNIISEGMKMRKEQGLTRPDLINLFVEPRKANKPVEKEPDILLDDDMDQCSQDPHREFTNAEITTQALIFFFAGFDTVSTALCFATYELAINPIIQSKLRDEINRVWTKTKGNINYELISDMKYLDMVLSEILRKWPPAVLLDRYCTKSYTVQATNSKEQRMTIDRGQMIWIPVQGIHMNPDYYPDPEKLDPERFSDENKSKLFPYTYLPFGIGPRNCIGMRYALLEIKILLVQLLHRFEIVQIDKSVVPVKLKKSGIYHSADGGFWFGFKRLHL